MIKGCHCMFRTSKLSVKFFSKFKDIPLSMAPPIKSVSSPCCFDANNILNNSQGVASHLQNLQGTAVGHPRFHVLCRKDIDKIEILNDLPSLGCTEVVTGHQRNWKTAFLSREDQNQALHKILRTNYGRHAVDLLEQGQNEVVLKASMRTLMPNLMMMKVQNGERLGTVPVPTCLLILGHHVNKPNGTYLHVKTFYPLDREIAGEYEIE